MAIYSVQIHGSTYDVEIHDLHDGRLAVRLGEKAGTVSARRLLDYARAHPDEDIPAGAVAPVVPHPEPVQTGDDSLSTISAPMPGVVSAISKALGDEVSESETVLTLEAMKMQNAVVSPCDGALAELHVAVGETVQMGQLLATVAPRG